MLTQNGLDVKRLPEILEDTVRQQQEEVHPDIGQDENDFLYQNTVVYSYLASLLWELAQSVNDNFNPDEAEGRNLDDLGVIVGVTRIPSSLTAGEQYFEGANNTVLPSYTTLENSLTKDKFFIVGDLAITTDKLRKVWVEVPEAIVGDTYTLSINGRNYSYVAETGDTDATILQKLKDAVDLDLDKEVVAEFDSVESQLVVETSSPGTDISVNLTANIRTVLIRVAGRIQAERSGKIVAPPHSITRVLTPINGLESTTNPSQLITGRDRETDEEYRIRIKNDQTINGAATIPAITSNLRNIQGVTYVAVAENNTMSTDVEGRPPKSLEAVVQGGSDADIAKTLWDIHGGGIQTFGTITVAVLDDENQSQEVKFSRPTPLNIAVRITYTLYEEEVFPVGGEDVIRTVVRDYVNAQGLGKDAIPTRYFGTIYQAVSGIGDLVVEIQEIASPGDIPDPNLWQKTSINITERHFAQTTLSDVTVIPAAI